MKTLNRILSAAILVTTMSLANSASAQYKINEADGIAASPRTRQMLNEQKASAKAAAVTPRNQTSTTLASNDGIAASPKTRQTLDEQKKNSAVKYSSTAVASTTYNPTGADGITASPR